jgi:hypothetical protein
MLERGLLDWRLGCQGIGLCQLSRHENETGNVDRSDLGDAGGHHAHQLGKPILMDVPVVCKCNQLFAVQLGMEKGSVLIGGAAETRGGGERFETACGSVGLLDAPMVLLDMVVQVAVRPVRHLVPEDGPNGPRLGVVVIGGDAVGRYPSHRPRRTIEDLGRCEVPRVAEAYVHEGGAAADPCPVSGVPQ